MPHISDLIEPWNDLTELLDDLDVERILEQQLPPGRRHAADKLHRLLLEISELMLDAEIDDSLSKPSRSCSRAKGNGRWALNFGQ